MKILLLDIETKPAIVATFGLFNQNIGLNQVIENSDVLCWAAKWAGAPKRSTEFRSEHHDGRQVMLERMWALIDEADAVVHYNGVGFDMKWLNGTFATAGLGRTSPYKNIDLFQVVKKHFRFTSHKLAHILQLFQLPNKISNSGFGLWLACMRGEKKAWGEMKKYNIGDVIPLEMLYTELLPWIDNHPNMNLHRTDGVEGCPKCGCDEMEETGKTVKTGTSAFAIFQCQGCGGFAKSNKRVFGTTTQNAS